MAIDQEIISYILGILGIGGVVFGIFQFFRKPQEKSEINDAVFDEKFLNLKQNTDEKIKSVLDLVVNLRDNHLAHIDLKFDKHIEKQIENEKVVSTQFTQIFTILDERLPKRSKK